MSEDTTIERWYYSIRGAAVKHGATDRDGLARLAGEGHLRPSDLVFGPDTGNRWVSAARVPGLRFSAPASASGRGVPAAAAHVTPGFGSRRRIIVDLAMLALLVVLLVTWIAFRVL